ncbi:MAG: twin-arginine translocation signal domain-containing protein [Microlunatus sp.]|nr:twin-arginine translocation signal domain-containing protein [Microlunatus sp.]
MPMPSLLTQVHPVTRRRFLAFSGVAAAGALAVGATRIN